MDPIIKGGLISAGGNLLSSGLGAIGSYMTNKTNKEIAQMKNEAMLMAMREQTKAEQDYNSISAQMKRHMLAGLNPLTLAEQGATSASSSGVPSLDSPVMQNPFGNFDTGLGHVGSSLIQAKQFDLQDRNLDVAEFESKLELLKVAGDLLKDSSMTSNDVNNIVKSIFGDSPDNVTFEGLFKDDLIKRQLKASVESSETDRDTKKYLYSWLDEMTNAQYLETLSRIEANQASSKKSRSDIDVNKSQINLNNTLASLNVEKRKEVEQAIANMEEQWKTLNFEGELSAAKLKELTTITDSVVQKLESEAKLTKRQAQFLVWQRINESVFAGASVVGAAAKFITK